MWYNYTPIRMTTIEKIYHANSGILLSHKKEQNNAICSNMNGTRESHTK